MMKRKMKIIGILLVIIALAVGIQMFVCRVKVIEVEGTERYTAEDMRRFLIKKPTDDNSFLLWWRTKEGIDPDIPYVERLTVSMLSNAKILVKVKESAIMLQQPYAQGYIDIDMRGVVQGTTPTRNGLVLLLHDGVEAGKTYGERLDGISPEQLEYMKTLAEQLGRHPALPFRDVRIKESGFELFTDRLVVRLGAGERMAEKMEELSRMYPEIADLSGTVHLEEYHSGEKGYRFENNG